MIDKDFNSKPVRQTSKRRWAYQCNYTLKLDKHNLKPTEMCFFFNKELASKVQDLVSKSIELTFAYRDLD